MDSTRLLSVPSVSQAERKRLESLILTKIMAELGGIAEEDLTKAERNIKALITRHTKES